MAIIIPAIDLLGGKAVRLTKGDYNKKTVYEDNPVIQGKKFQEMGAGYLHLVDLDGAKTGSNTNFETIKNIRKELTIPIEVGGGIRTEEAINKYLEIGVNRVILGTIALKNISFVKEMIEKYGNEKIVVGVDVRNGYVSTDGWLKDSDKTYLDFIEELKNIGVKYIICTDISKDGMLSGPNFSMYEKIKGINVVVSGGISSEEDIEKAMKYYGVIVGKAYYEGKVDLEKVIKITK
ncbi:MAG: 1-(5-phosphoribosyl)-5-[(5-phosphoribosylamino)methylideneamino]imidazole-4-carboxamide isomerase [Lachnospiraceae bacterium]|jgi:phosphoribosylformimino-5-aminoimidazole carboxamide ribotide isomerase|nr:1-(5-phosphoribosyl)-5-[(5-phosphoribosylamino)methylideneamino]imidazole-4-carboxamide isomerase [Lachnospiraceae bacterium]